ncbi:MAG: serine/threonine-protein kinase, partial [Planctomycetota bacterium]
MEFLEGRELAEILEEEKQLDPFRVAKIMVDVFSALQFTHEIPDGKALLHLDLKPQNIFILGAAERGAETAKVIDFGISQNVSNDLAEVGQVVLDEDLEDEDLLERTIFPAARPGGVLDSGSGRSSKGSKGSSSDSSSATSSSRESRVPRAKGGTVLYSSPEQCKHLRKDGDIEVLDGRSDVYSLGVVGFKALTGSYPFERKAQTLKEAYRQHLMEPPRKVREARPKVPRRIAAVIDRCLEKDKEKRFQSAAEAKAAMERAMEPVISKGVAAAVLLMAVPLSALLVYITFFVKPEYSTLEGLQLVTRDANGAEQASRRLGNSAPLYVASGGDGWQYDVRFSDEFKDSQWPSGVPRLFKGRWVDESEGTPVEGVVLSYSDNVLTMDTAGADLLSKQYVHLRWEKSRTHSGSFEMEIVGDLEYRMGALSPFVFVDGAPLPGPQSVFRDSVEPLRAQITGDKTGLIDRIGFRFDEASSQTGADPSSPPDQDLAGIVWDTSVKDTVDEVSIRRLFSDAGSLDAATTGQVTVFYRDKCGRVAMVGEPVAIVALREPTAFDQESFQLSWTADDERGAHFSLESNSEGESNRIPMPPINSLSL